MHVLINGWFFGDTTSGSGQYLHYMSQHLPRAAPTVKFTLLLCSKQALGDSHFAIEDAPPNLGIEVVSALPKQMRVPQNLRKLWWEQVTVPQMARQMNASVVWVPYWAASFWQPRPTVVTVHDLIPMLLPDYRGGLLNRIYTTLVARTARRSAAVITVSHASARDIITQLQIPGERVFAVHHGPNRTNTVQADNAFLADVRRRLDLPERFFLYLGGFDVRKNVHTTLLAYQRYLALGGARAVKLVIAGKLPAEDSAFAPDPQTIAAELGLTEQVHFCGWIDEADKPALYALATAYLFPSTYEGFGMMVLEAMSAGTPVVTSKG